MYEMIGVYVIAAEAQDGTIVQAQDWREIGAEAHMCKLNGVRTEAQHVQAER
jgi:hypothetical protein